MNYYWAPWCSCLSTHNAKQDWKDKKVLKLWNSEVRGWGKETSHTTLEAGKHRMVTGSATLSYQILHGQWGHISVESIKLSRGLGVAAWKVRLWVGLRMKECIKSEFQKQLTDTTIFSHFLQPDKHSHTQWLYGFSSFDLPVGPQLTSLKR